MVDIFLIMDNIFKSAHLELRRNASVLVKEPTKLTKLNSVVGYPKWIMDEKKVASYTPTGKRFNDDPFVYYYVSCAQLHMKNKLRTLLGKARPGEGQPFNAAMVNAYYSRTDNKIGRKYTDDGTLFNWWPPMTEAKFRKKAQCFLEQYGNVTDPVTHMKVRE
ncbi:hypothetical protein HPB51_009183 [Rhipicephalus microplus]|uniref:Uncharacterized protein n=1 Tax=Rhipicephalus microplus TaxID=6941 RepID=A0A9J6F0A6_RHIMP|nr:hypothetical protein HPB51_009183 [Rhipicephalus microplus]